MECVWRQSSTKQSALAVYFLLSTSGQYVFLFPLCSVFSNSISHPLFGPSALCFNNHHFPFGLSSVEPYILSSFLPFKGEEKLHYSLEMGPDKKHRYQHV